MYRICICTCTVFRCSEKSKNRITYWIVWLLQYLKNRAKHLPDYYEI